MRNPIRNIYGFVRFADEIVDSFHGHDKPKLLAAFREQTYDAIASGISLNPILNSFQRTVNTYDIDLELVESFFRSMAEDLNRDAHNEQSYREYIYGSAEVVGLMCLHVFCEGEKSLYRQLEPSARALGAAFQKVNFLRDIKADYAGLSRSYFPGFDFNSFSEPDKQRIEEDIRMDFVKASEGIRQLPVKSRFGVYLAYKYYLSLFKKIEGLKPAHVMERRVRIPNFRKALIVLRAGVKNQLRML
jgi:phytoene/squalene synthetase